MGNYYIFQQDQWSKACVEIKRKIVYWTENTPPETSQPPDVSFIENLSGEVKRNVNKDDLKSPSVNSKLIILQETT